MTNATQPNARNEVRRFFSKALLMLPALLVVPAVNLIVDPANLFKPVGVHEKAMADSLVKGRNVVNFDRYDVRIEQKDLLEITPIKPRILILGSSRPGLIGAAMYPNESIFSATILSASLEDCIAMYHMTIERGMRPEVVIWGIDPWMLNEWSWDSRTLAMATELNGGFADISMRNWRADSTRNERSRLSALISPDYFQQSLQFIPRWERRLAWFTSSVAYNKGYTKLPDGSYTVTDEERTMPLARVNARAQEYIDRDEVLGYKGFTRVSPDHLEAIERIFKKIRQDGARPILYLPPYHPKVWAFLTSKPRYQIAMETEQALRSMAARNNIEVIGAYDPSVVGLGEADFYDGIHTRNESLKGLLSKNLSIFGADSVAGRDSVK